MSIYIMFVPALQQPYLFCNMNKINYIPAFIHRFNNFFLFFFFFFKLRNWFLIFFFFLLNVIREYGSSSSIIEITCYMLGVSLC